MTGSSVQKPSNHPRVLIASDGSSGADKAIHFAVGLFKQSPADFRIVTVLSYELYPYAIYGPPENFPLSDADKRLELIKRTEEKAAKALGEGEGVHSLTTTHRFGHPQEELVREMEEWKPEMVVVGRQGLGHLERLMLGSVSSFLVKHSPVPVLVVP